MINPNFGSVRGDSYAYIAVPADANQYVAASIDGKIYGTSLASPDGHAMIGVSKPGTYTLHNVRNSGLLGDALFTVTVTERHKIYGVSYSTPETRAKAFSDITEDEFLAISKDIEAGNITSDDLPWKVGDKNTKFTRKKYTDHSNYYSDSTEYKENVPFTLVIADISTNKYAGPRKHNYIFIVPELLTIYMYRSTAGVGYNWSTEYADGKNKDSVAYVLGLYQAIYLNCLSDSLRNALKPLTVKSNGYLIKTGTDGSVASTETTFETTEFLQAFNANNIISSNLNDRFELFKKCNTKASLGIKIYDVFGKKSITYTNDSQTRVIMGSDTGVLYGKLASIGVYVDTTAYRGTELKEDYISTVGSTFASSDNVIYLCSALCAI